MSEKIAHLDNDSFKAAVAGPTPVLIDFWAPWCGPCKAIAPILDELATELEGKLKIGKVNVDDNGDLAAQYGVNSIPRILVFKGGTTPVHSVIGLQNEAALTKLLNSVV